MNQKEDTVWLVNPGGRVVEVWVGSGPVFRERDKRTGELRLSLARNWRMANEEEIEKALAYRKAKFDRDSKAQEDIDDARTDAKVLVEAARDLRKSGGRKKSKKKKADDSE